MLFIITSAYPINWYSLWSTISTLTNFICYCFPLNLWVNTFLLLHKLLFLQIIMPSYCSMQLFLCNKISPLLYVELEETTYPWIYALIHSNKNCWVKGQCWFSSFVVSLTKQKRFHIERLHSPVHVPWGLHLFHGIDYHSHNFTTGSNLDFIYCSQTWHWCFCSATHFWITF